LPKGVEHFLDLGPTGPVTVAAVALIVDGGSLVTADALLAHEGETALGSAWLRLRVVVERRQERGRPLGEAGLLCLLGGERGEDRLPFSLVGLGRDVCGLHRKRVMLGVAAVDEGNVGQRLATLAAACAV